MTIWCCNHVGLPNFVPTVLTLFNFVPEEYSFNIFVPGEIKLPAVLSMCHFFHWNWNHLPFKQSIPEQSPITVLSKFSKILTLLIFTVLSSKFHRHFILPKVPMDNERTGTSGGDEPVACEIDRTNEPYEGMEFESDEAAKVFYEEYARRVGFLTRILNSRKSERDGSLISRHLGCRGIVGSKKADAQNQKRNRPKEPCPATVMVKRDEQGKWVVRKFVREHNHALEDPSQNKRPTLDDKDRKIQDLINELRIKKRLSATYRDQLFELMKDVEEHNENLAVKVQGVRDKLRALESRKQAPRPG